MSYHRTYEDVSRGNWGPAQGRAVTENDVKIGALLRVASALEKICTLLDPDERKREQKETGKREESQKADREFFRPLRKAVKRHVFEMLSPSGDDYRGEYEAAQRIYSKVHGLCYDAVEPTIRKYRENAKVSTSEWRNALAAATEVLKQIGPDYDFASLTSGAKTMARVTAMLGRRRANIT